MSWYNIFGINAHHIFPESLSDRRRDLLLSIGIDVDSWGNIKPMWSSNIAAEIYRIMPDSARDFFEKAGWGSKRRVRIHAHAETRQFHALRDVPTGPGRSPALDCLYLGLEVLG